MAMASTASGSEGHKPPPGNQDTSKDTAHRAPNKTPTPPSGDGKTPGTAAWSTALINAPKSDKTYVVNGLGLIPRYRRTTLQEARMADQVYQILDGDTYESVYQLPAGPMINQTMSNATGTAQQVTEIEEQETAISAGTGPAADQYNASQAYRK